MSKSILTIPLSDEQLHSAARRFSGRLAAAQHEQLDEGNANYRVESAELKARRLRIFEAHSRIEAFADFLEALKEFKEIHSEEHTNAVMVRRRINSLRETEQELSRQQELIAGKELGLKELEGRLRKERVDFEEERNRLRRQVERTDLVLLLEAEKNRTETLTARLSRSRDLNSKQFATMETSLRYWFSLHVRRSAYSSQRQLPWQNIFETTQITCAEFSFTQHWDEARLFAPMSPKEKLAHEQFLSELRPDVLGLYDSIIERVANLAKKKSGNRNRVLSVLLRNLEVVNGCFLDRTVRPQNQQGEAVPPREYWERILGSLSINSVEESPLKLLEHLPARWFSQVGLPFVVPGNLLASHSCVDFTATGMAPGKTFYELLSSRTSDSFRKAGLRTCRIILDVNTTSHKS